MRGRGGFREPYPMMPPHYYGGRMPMMPPMYRPGPPNMNFRQQQPYYGAGPQFRGPPPGAGPGRPFGGPSQQPQQAQRPQQPQPRQGPQGSQNEPSNGARGGQPTNTAVGGSQGHLLDLIQQYESPGGNVRNFRFDATHTAQGYYQITNTNWRNIAPHLGIDLRQYPSAMAAPKAVQAQVANYLLTRTPGGIGNWSHYNPRLAVALRQHGYPTSGRVPNHLLGGGPGYNGPQGGQQPQNLPQPDPQGAQRPPDDAPAPNLGEPPGLGLPSTGGGLPAGTTVPPPTPANTDPSPGPAAPVTPVTRETLAPPSQAPQQTAGTGFPYVPDQRPAPFDDGGVAARVLGDPTSLDPNVAQYWAPSHMGGGGSPGTGFSYIPDQRPPPDVANVGPDQAQIYGQIPAAPTQDPRNASIPGGYVEPQGQILAPGDNMPPPLPPPTPTATNPAPAPASTPPNPQFSNPDPTQPPAWFNPTPDQAQSGQQPAPSQALSPPQPMAGRGQPTGGQSGLTRPPHNQFAGPGAAQEDGVTPASQDAPTPEEGGEASAAPEADGGPTVENPGGVGGEGGPVDDTAGDVPPDQDDGTSGTDDGTGGAGTDVGAVPTTGTAATGQGPVMPSIDLGVPLAFPAKDPRRYDAIANAEKTRNPDGSIAWGRVSNGGGDQNLENMTIGQVSDMDAPAGAETDFGGMQINRQDLIPFATALKMDPNTTKFDRNTQEALADYAYATQHSRYWRGLDNDTNGVAQIDGMVYGATKIAVKNYAELDAEAKKTSAALSAYNKALKAAADRGEFNTDWWVQERHRAFLAEKRLADIHEEIRRNPPQRTGNDIEQGIGSTVMALGMVGGSLSSLPANVALGLLGTAISARTARNDKDYKEAWDHYKDAMGFAAAGAALESRLYQETLTGQKADVAAAVDKLYPLSMQFKNQRLSELWQQGRYNEAVKLMESLSKVSKQLQLDHNSLVPIEEGRQWMREAKENWINASPENYQYYQSHGDLPPATNLALQAQANQIVQGAIGTKAGKYVDPASVEGIRQALLNQAYATHPPGWVPTPEDLEGYNQKATASGAKTSERTAEPKEHLIIPPPGSNEPARRVSLGWDAANNVYREPGKSGAYQPPPGWTIRAAVKTPAAIHTIETRLKIAGRDIGFTLQSMTAVPMGTTLGYFGGAQAALTGQPVDNFKRALLNKITPQGSQFLATLARGMARSLASLASGGAAQGLMQLARQLEADVPQEGDTNLNQLLKLADIRQLADAALMTLAEDDELSPEARADATRVMNQIHAAVPYTTRDVVKLEYETGARTQQIGPDGNPVGRGGLGNPGALKDETVKEFANRIRLGLPEISEQDYQQALKDGRIWPGALYRRPGSDQVWQAGQ